MSETSTLIQSRRVWLAGQFSPLQLEIKGGRIDGVYPYALRDPDIDYKDNRIVPGFMDIHTHGAYGFDTNDADPEGLRKWAGRLPEEGVASFLPTTVSDLPPVLTASVKNVADVTEAGYEGAEILGIHLEGPYLDMGRRGAQPPEAVVPADVEEFKRYQQAARGMIRYITLAPEHDEGLRLTKYCAQNGVAVSMGHSGASYEQALLAAANGALSATHVYNGMPPFHHREPGLLGAALRLRNLFGEIICDGLHAHPAAVYHFFAAKGPDFPIMVTDSLRVKNCPPGGIYRLGGHEIEVDRDGAARLKDSGTLAGSTLRMNRGLKFLVEEAMVPFDAALNACTINPARLLGEDRRKGKLAAGYDADIVILADDYEVIQTYCRGRIVYTAAKYPADWQYQKN